MIMILFVTNGLIFEDVSAAHNINMPTDNIESDAAYGVMDKAK